MGVLFAMSVFVLSHIVISRSTLKPSLIARIGRTGYLVVYSVQSLALLSWVVLEVVWAERVVLWDMPSWASEFAAFFSLSGFILIGVGAISRNPLSVGFQQSPFDASRPGAIGWVRHPILWGFVCWGVAHIPANGEWPTLILFAGSAVFGLLGVRGVEARLKLKFGEEEWSRLTAGQGHIDSAAIFGSILGVILWIVLLWVHPYFAGVDPLAHLFNLSQN